MLALDNVDLHIPDAGPVFRLALAIHVAAALTCVAAGIVSTTAVKGTVRHRRAGVVYLYGIGVVFVTVAVMAGLRWRQDWHLLAIGAVASGLAALGWWARRRRGPGWLARHGWAMAGSYATLFTGFYVDNGPHLPLWDRLPHVLYWLIPAAVAAPLTWFALVRNRALGADGGTRRDADRERGGSALPSGR